MDCTYRVTKYSNSVNQNGTLYVCVFSPLWPLHRRKVGGRACFFFYKPSCFSLENSIILLLTSLFTRLIRCENWKVCKSRGLLHSIYSKAKGIKYNCSWSTDQMLDFLIIL